MKKHSTFYFILLAATFIFLFTLPIAAQKRRPARSRLAATKMAANAATNTAAVKVGGQQVSDQIKALSRFLYLYGGSIQPLQGFEIDSKQGKLSAAAKQKGEVGKKAIIITFATFKNSMLKLEEDFRANTALKPYLLQLVGVAETATTAEEQAQANQFDSAGRSLLDVLNQLSDTLQAMP